MKANIYSHRQLIGTTDLQVGDKSMGCVFGEFSPNDLYFNDIQKFVWEFWVTNKPDYEKWHSLRFNVQLENGYFLNPVGGYTIDDIPEFPNESKRIDIAGLDRHIMDDFFNQEIPKPFIEAPWERMTIEQKIAFEDELNKEIGVIDRPFFDSFKSDKEKHVLSEFKFSALCKCGYNDDVLFVARQQDFDKQFAVIHLTWKGEKEEGNFPSAVFYKDFDEFKYLRMYPDKIEWDD